MTQPIDDRPTSTSGSLPTTLILSTRAHPHEQFFFGLSIILGLSYILGAPKPGSIDALMPKWEILVWAIGLFVSGPIGLFGCWWKRDIPFALGMELAGLLINSAAILMYSVAALFLGIGWRASLPIGISIAWTMANLVRAQQIRRELHAIDTGG